jgi:hypothetical protein
MSENGDLERRVAAWVADERAMTAPVRVLDEILTSTSRQRPLPRWLALIKEPPMRVSSRVTVGSPTARVISVVAAASLLAMLCAGAVVAGASYLAGSGPIVVAQDGSGTFTTITEAVAVAEAGDTILVRPGVYRESVTIIEDITLRGDGPRDEVVIEVALGGPTFPTEFGPSLYGLMIEGSDAEVSDVTVRAAADVDKEEVVVTGVGVQGGAPTIHDVTTTEDIGAAAWIRGGSTGTVADSILGGIVFVPDSSAAIIERNTIRAHVMVGNSPGTAPVVIRENVLAGVTIAPDDPNWVGTAGPALIERNQVRLPDGEADAPPSDFLGINLVSSQGFEVIGNDVAGFAAGIDIRFGSTGVAEDNVLADNTVGMIVASASSGTDALRVAGNTVTGGGTGIQVAVGTPRLDGNSVEGAEIGLEVMGFAGPTLSGNVLCGNRVNLSIVAGAEPVLEENEICPDGLATSGG